MAQLALFLVISTFPVWIYLRRRRIFASEAVTVGSAWFIGQWIAGTVIGALATLMSFWTDGLLAKATWIYMICGAGVAMISLRRLPPIAPLKIARLALIILAGWGAAKAIVPQHLGIRDGVIYHSSMYGDFAAHFTLVQSFVFGDNFPPQNEGAAGTPVMYHFFYHLLVAVYSVLGLELVDSINFASCLTLTMLLTVIIGLGETVFRSTLAGVLAAILFLFNSSLRFVFELTSALVNGFGATIDDVLQVRDPYGFAMQASESLQYNGNMFNLFYLIAERHLIFGCGLTAVYLALLSVRSALSRTELVMLGVMVGLTFYWHLYVSIGFGALLGFLCLFRRYRLESLIVFVPFATVFALQAAWVAWLLSGGDPVMEQIGPPRIDTSFMSQIIGRTMSLSLFVFSCLFMFGFEAPAAIAGFYSLPRSAERRRVLACAALIFFALTNLLAIGSISVLNNHKFTKPLDVALSILAGGAVARLVRYDRLVMAVVATLLLTASGIIENTTVVRQSLLHPYARYPSDIIAAIRENSGPREVFRADNTREVLLAGRKTFFAHRKTLGRANSMFFADVFRHTRRRVIHELYTSTTLEEFCAVAVRNGIDFVEFDEPERKRKLFPKLGALGRFEGFSEHKGQSLIYVDTADCPRPIAG